MMKIYTPVIIVLFFISCQKKSIKPSYYFGVLDNKIVKIEGGKAILFNIEDSTKVNLEINDSKTIKTEKGVFLKYSLTKDSLIIFDENKILSNKNIIHLSSFKNEIDVNFDNDYLKHSSSDIIVNLNKTKFISYYKNKIFEMGDYFISNDFYNYNLFVTNSVKTFSDSYYLILEHNNKGLVLIDMRTSKKSHFLKYKSNLDSLIFGNWKRIREPNSLDSNRIDTYKNDTFTCLRNNIIIKKDSIVFDSINQVDSKAYYFNLGLNSKFLFINHCSVLEIKKLTRDSLILYDENIVIPEYRILKYCR